MKVTGGMFGGDFSQDTADRLAGRFFTVRVTHTGTPVFVDDRGREVTLYMTVDPARSPAGLKALAAYHADRAAAQKLADEQEARYKAEIETLLDELSPAEAIRRLKSNT